MCNNEWQNKQPYIQMGRESSLLESLLSFFSTFRDAHKNIIPQIF